MFLNRVAALWHIFCFSSLVSVPKVSELVITILVHLLMLYDIVHLEARDA